jgi:hypothetical protein
MPGDEAQRVELVDRVSSATTPPPALRAAARASWSDNKGPLGPEKSASSSGRLLVDAVDHAKRLMTDPRVPARGDDSRAAFDHWRRRPKLEHDAQATRPSEVGKPRLGRPPKQQRSSPRASRLRTSRPARNAATLVGQRAGHAASST